MRCFVTISAYMLSELHPSEVVFSTSLQCPLRLSHLSMISGSMDTNNVVLHQASDPYSLSPAVSPPDE